jgi:hypothetical protein
MPGMNLTPSSGGSQGSPGPKGDKGDPGGLAPASTVEISAAQALMDATVNGDNTSTDGWPNRWTFWFKVFGGVARRVFYLNEYFEPRVVPARTTTVPFRVFSKEFNADPSHGAGVPLIEVQSDRDNRTRLFAVHNDGSIESPSIAEKVVTVPEGTTGWAGQPDGTLWVEYDPNG